MPYITSHDGTRSKKQHSSTNFKAALKTYPNRRTRRTVMSIGFNLSFPLTSLCTKRDYLVTEHAMRYDKWVDDGIKPAAHDWADRQFYGHP